VGATEDTLCLGMRLTERLCLGLRLTERLEADL